MARPLHSFITALTMGALLVAPAYGAPLAPAPAGVSEITAAHVTVNAGDLAVERDGSSDHAPVNSPIFAGDSVVTASKAAEVEIDATTVVRLARDSSITVEDLTKGNRLLQIDRGTVEVRAFANPGMQIVTPNVAAELAEAGAYRIHVMPASSSVTVRSGRASVPVPGGDDLAVAPGLTLDITGTPDRPIVNFTAGRPHDDFDAWNEARDLTLGDSINDTRVNPVFGANALDLYGTWKNNPAYGTVWSPNEQAGWAPYTIGSWVDIYPFGPTWVSSEPWGWAPYHYGRWVFDAMDGWLWIPGDEMSWAPALVGFLQPVTIGRSPAPGTWYPLPPPHLFVRPGTILPNPSVRIPEAHSAARASSGGGHASGGGGGGHSSGGGGGSSRK